MLKTACSHIISDWSKQEPARIQHLRFEIIRIDAFHGPCVWPLNEYWGSHARLFKHVLWQLRVPTGDIKTTCVIQLYFIISPLD